MALSIELPSPLDEELAIEAEREGISVSDQAALLLHLMTAMTREGRETPFRGAVRSFPEQNKIDVGHVAKVCEALMLLCLHDSEGLSKPLEHPSTNRDDRMGTDHARSLLRKWRSPDVHQSVDKGIDVSRSGSPPLDDLIQRPGRVRRPSALGKYAWLKMSSEDYALEKQREIDREDRRR